MPTLPFKYFLDLGHALLEVAVQILQWFSRPIKDIAWLPFGDWLNGKIFDLVGKIPIVGDFYNMSLLEAILGPGLLVLLVVILVKWVLDFVL